MSADAAKIAFGVLKEHLAASGGSEKKKQKVYKKLNFLLQTGKQCAMIQLSSEITELYDVISKELKIKESCPIGRTGRKETIWRLH